MTSIYQDWNEVSIGNGGKKKQQSKEVNPYNTAKARAIREVEEETSMMPKLVSTPQELIIILKQTREAKGLTQQDLAQKLSMNVSIVNNFEAGKTPFNKNLYCKMLRVMGGNTKGIEFPKN